MKHEKSLIIGLPGKTLTNHEKQWLLHPAVAGVILFSHNYESKDQLKTLTEAIHHQRHDLFICVDHEGGRVQRFKEGFTAIPPMGTLGELYQEDRELALNQAEVYGEIIATELHSVGVDFSFAPVLDLDYHKSDIIGNRAFSSDPLVVSKLARCFIQGLHNHGSTSCGKHFPGHGFVVPDSHIADPIDTRSLSEIWDKDLVPYRELIHDLDAIMTAHICFPEVDQEIVSYSSVWIKEILRGRLGYQGLIISDDLVMHAAGKQPPLERVYKALDAGCDMVLYCQDYDGIEAILNDFEVGLKRA